MKDTLPRPALLEKIVRTQSLLAQAHLDLDAFMQIVVDTLQELTDAKGAVVELVEGDEMVYRAGSAGLAQHVGLRLRRANSLSGLCVAQACILHCEDSETDPRVDAAACRKVGVRSMLCTPLFEEGVPVGVLKVMSEQVGAFDKGDVQVLSLMGDALGAALGRQVAFSALQRAQARLLVSEERTRTILEYANDAVISIDGSGHICQWNRAAEQLFGWSNGEVIGRPVAEVVVPPLYRDSFSRGLLKFRAGAVSSDRRRKEYTAINRQGDELTVEVSLNVHTFADGIEVTAFLHDVSDRKQLEQALRHLALSDGLTGLPNRRRFMESLEQAIARQQRLATGLALLFMDLNGFKPVNDTYGHAVGDSLLKEVASRVSGSLRAGDMVARLGGDEFVVLAEGLQTVDQARVIAAKIVAALALPLPGTAIVITASIGFALFEPSMDAAQLLRAADLKMYEEKSRGKVMHPPTEPSAAP